MVAGQSGLGKTTFLATLFEEHLQPPLENAPERASAFNIYAPTDYIKTYVFELSEGVGQNITQDDSIPHERLFIEAIDTPGFSDDVDPEVRLSEIKTHLENAFDEVFDEEQRVHRNPKFEEHRVHVLLYFLEPTGLGLKSFDAELMKRLSERVNVIPVIAKADSLTSSERVSFKRRIMEDIRIQGIQIFDFEAASESLPQEQRIILDQHLPFCIVGTITPRAKESKRGRPYPWGLVEVDNPIHSDFLQLKRALLYLYRDELKETTEDTLYEQYRTEKLLNSDKADRVTMSGVVA